MSFSSSLSLSTKPVTEMIYREGSGQEAGGDVTPRCQPWHCTAIIRDPKDWPGCGLPVCWVVALTCWAQGLPPGGKATGKCRVRWGGTILLLLSTLLSQ